LCFGIYNKSSSTADIVRAIKNIQAKGMNVRGLFIVGAENHTPGIGDRLAEFVLEYDIRGVLIQSMYFIPGTPVYEENKDRLLHQDWSKYCGHVVHNPARMTAYQLQIEIIQASRKIYSLKNTIKAILTRRWREKLLFLGERFWQRSVCRDLRHELPNLPGAE
jgi:radical SAM superfamily enzyme